MVLFKSVFLAILILKVIANTSSHYCDYSDTYVDSECVYYEGTTTGDACLIYSETNFCIRCMQNTYLTPA